VLGKKGVNVTDLRGLVYNKKIYERQKLTFSVEDLDREIEAVFSPYIADNDIQIF